MTHHDTYSIVKGELQLEVSFYMGENRDNHDRHEVGCDRLQIFPQEVYKTNQATIG